MQPLNFGNGWVISTLEWACDYLDMLRLKSIHVKGPQEDHEVTVYTPNTLDFFQMLVQTNNKEPSNYRL